MLSRNPRTWAGIGLAVLLAAVIGVQLGESAIAGINPIHFQGAAVHPRDRGAAIDPAIAPPPLAQANYYEAYGWDQGNAARLGECPGCGPYPATQTYIWSESPPTARLGGEAWRDVTPVAEPQPWPPGETEAEGRRQVVRYADYPIEEKPAVETAEVAETAEPDKSYEEAE